MIELVAATKNLGKLQELQAAVPAGIQLHPLPATITPVKETGSTYLENAVLKARHYYSQVKQPVVADDGGLELTAFPTILGLKTQRFFTSTDPKEQNNQLLALFSKRPELPRDFVLHATLVYFDGQHCFSSHQQLAGLITTAQGSEGFGFDPIMYLPEETKTLGQLSQSVRDVYSPRVRALKQVLQQVKAAGLLD